MNKPFTIGLTGSIGMGKTTTAGMFRAEGIPVWDADAAVHRLYAPGAPGAVAIAKLHPAAIVDGHVDREILKDWIDEDETALERIENVIHPLVAADRDGFIDSSDSDIVVLDIPLLFETGLNEEVDAVVVCSTTPEIQRERVMQRPGMSRGRFKLILSHQTPDAEKRAGADFIVETETMSGARGRVKEVLAEIRRRIADA